MKKHLLFVCSGAIDRSPAAVDLFLNSRKYSARAAGTHVDAKQRVTQRLIDWADYVFVMSEGTNKHLSFLRDNFDIRNKNVFDLHVRDMYFRKDPRLKRILLQRIGNIVHIE